MTDQAHLHIVTWPEPPEPTPCTNEYTCECAQCEADRERRKRVGVRPRALDQTWQPRRAA